jgi:undecaprenyl-diphosphatase
MINKLIQLDQELLIYLNGLHTPFFDKLMWLITENYLWLPFYIFLLYLLIRKFGKRAVLVILFLAIGVAISDLVSVNVFKNVFHRLRPSHAPGIEQLLHYVNNYRGGDFGFVSSHAANTFMVAVFLLQVFRNKWLTLSLLIWCSLMSYSRVYLGVHYPGDILCGAALGSTLAYFLGLLYKWTDRKWYDERKVPVK